MIRTRNEIDIDIEAKRRDLGDAIHNSISAENRSKKYIASINKRLSEIASELCFEETLEGKVKALEDTASGKIREIIEELSEATGKDYKSNPNPNTFFSALNTYSDCLKPFFVGSAGKELL